MSDDKDPEFVPDHIAQPMMAHAAAQDAARGDWQNPREADQPDPPWPTRTAPFSDFCCGRLKSGSIVGWNPVW
jgi:hypothetical protein